MAAQDSSELGEAKSGAQTNGGPRAGGGGQWDQKAFPLLIPAELDLSGSRVTVDLGNVPGGFGVAIRHRHEGEAVPTVAEVGPGQWVVVAGKRHRGVKRSDSDLGLG
jgi:hypothetical protein